MKVGYAGNEVGWMVYDKVFEVAKVIGSLGISQDNYTDLDYYPPVDVDLELQVMYFMAMVSIDHRLNVPGHQFKSMINGKVYVGSDLLWRFGVEKLRSDASFFTPRSLAGLKPSDVKDWLGDVWDYGVRAFLLSDLGRKVLSFFNGSALSLLKSTGGRLLGSGGFTDMMRIFTAYTDPVEKKTFLLAKFLHGRGLIRFIDVDNAQVAVDNHLTRLALRLGLVELEQRYHDMVTGGVPFTPSEDVNLRGLVRDAWKLVSVNAGVNPFALDDYLWRLGRSVCIQDTPKCSTCPLRGVCNAYEKGVFINEHQFYPTYWY